MTQCSLCVYHAAIHAQYASHDCAYDCTEKQIITLTVQAYETYTVLLVENYGTWISAPWDPLPAPAYSIALQTTHPEQGLQLAADTATIALEFYRPG